MNCKRLFKGSYSALRALSRRHKSSSDFVKVVEVGPRDGLQNEKSVISTEDKVEFVNRLTDSGLSCIEVTSFVSPKWVPQMADSVAVSNSITRSAGVTYCAIVPNSTGLAACRKTPIDSYCVATAASETFCKRNWNCSIEKSLSNTEAIIREIRGVDASGKPPPFIRGYVSNVMGCPYEGDVKVSKIVELAGKLYDYGCTEISLGDTIGTGTPRKFKRMLEEVLKAVPREHIAVHCHDTYGQALPNILMALELGVRAVDSSTGGLGGCPYAPGAAGNVATEDLLYMLHGMGLHTNVDIARIVDAANFICSKIPGRTLQSKVGQAMSSSSVKSTT